MRTCTKQLNMAPRNDDPPATNFTPIHQRQNIVLKKMVPVARKNVAGVNPFDVVTCDGKHEER